MTDIYEKWIADFGIDGFRIDTMKHVDDEFWKAFGPRVLQFARDHGKREFFMFGEVFDTTKSYTSHFTTTDRMQSVLDFPFQDAARKFASGGAPTDQLAQFFTDDDWYTDADSNVYQLPTFLGNHDMGRIGGFVQADNPGAGDAEWVARDRLGHELMYFSRGNPVIYYGDEQGFTGPGGDQDARQTLFATRVPEYLDDDLLGTVRHPRAGQLRRRPPAVPVDQRPRALTAQHPGAARRRAAAPVSAPAAGVYAFSRIDRGQQREYVVALNNSEQPATAAIPTYTSGDQFKRVYGVGPGPAVVRPERRADGHRPALSTVVYALDGRIDRLTPRRRASPWPRRAGRAAGGRMQVTAKVGRLVVQRGDLLGEPVNGRWSPIGTDDTAPYRVFHDVSGLPSGTPVQYRAVVLDNAGHTAPAEPVRASVPAPAVRPSRRRPRAATCAARSRCARSPTRSEPPTWSRSTAASPAAPWTPIGRDSSSPAYTVFDDLTPLNLAAGTPVAYRAILPSGAPTGDQRGAHGPLRRSAAGRGHPALPPPGRRLRRLGPAPVGRRDRPGGARADRLGPAVAARPDRGRLGRVRDPAGRRHQAGELHHAPAQRRRRADTREPGGDRSFLPIDAPRSGSSRATRWFTQRNPPRGERGIPCVPSLVAGVLG